MSKVTHKNIDNTTFYYKGPCIINWTDKSSLVQVIQIVHEDFKVDPPLPMSMVGVVQKSAYAPEQVTVNRPYYSETRNSVKELSSDLKSNDELLLSMIVSDKEAEPIKAEIKKHMDEVQKLACKFVLNI